MALIECSECGEEISDKAEACVHCGCPMYSILTEATVLPKTKSKKPCFDRAYPSTEVNKTEPPNKSNILYVFLFFGAAFLHVLFCAESPLIFLSASNPWKSIVGSIGYSLPGMLISVLFLTPIVSYLSTYNSGGFSLKENWLKSATIALYIGAVVRFFIFLLS